MLRPRASLWPWLLFTIQAIATVSETSVQEVAVDEQGGTTAAKSPPQEQQVWKNPLEFLQNQIFAHATDSNPLARLPQGRHHHADSSDLFETLWKLVQPPVMTSDTSNIDEDVQHWHDVILASMKTNRTTLPSQSPFIMIRKLMDAFRKVTEQLQRTFPNELYLNKVNLLQIWYAMLAHESRKDAVWKRKQHRFLPEVSLEEAISLADGLYLSQLAYVSTCAQVHASLQHFRNDSWALINCTTVGQASEPAHFVAVRRQADALATGPFSFGTKRNRALEILLVVRGTKEIGDALSDAMLEPVVYQDGLAHEGILRSATWLHGLYDEFFQALRKASKSAHLNLWLVGHSLGAGTAALASWEFNSQTEKNVKARAVGYGTPAVVSKEISLAMASTVTTVINDADCVPRMSGATLTNAWLEMFHYNWTQDALDDLQLLIPVLRENLPKGETLLSAEAEAKITQWMMRMLQSDNIAATNLTTQRQDPQLFPPGDCVHFYRDGVRWQGNYLPCSRFNEIELVRFLMDDHFIPTGYYQGLLGFIRGTKDDAHWRFEPDPLSVPV